MNLYVANTIEKAIKIPLKIYGQSSAEQLINEHINRLFGGTDGDYFVLNSVKQRSINGKEYKIVLVEDRDQVKHQVYFEYVPLESNTSIR
jgi:hypothetical protein